MKRVVRAVSVMSLDDAFNEFILSKEIKGLSYDTIRNYKLSYSIFTRNTDCINCQDVTKHQIWAFIDSLKDNVSVTSINHYLRDIRSFIKFCIREGYTEDFEITLLKGQESLPKEFSESDILKLLKKPDKKDDFSVWRTWAIVNYILATGNRSSTVCNIKLGDLDFKNKEIYVSTTKNKRPQIIPMSNALEETLKTFIKIWRASCSQDEYLFCNYGGEKLTTNGSRQAFERYCAGRGVMQHNLHGLRHSFAKLSIKNGMNIFTLQSVLGHSTLDMTKKYVRLYSDDLKEGYSEVSPLDNLRTGGLKKGVQRSS